MTKIYFLLSFVVSVIISFLILDTQNTKRIEKQLETTTKKFEQNYNLIYEDYKSFAHIIFDTKIDTKEVKDIFKEASNASMEQKAILRQKLFLQLEETYNLLKHHNLQQLHFHLPNNESFLRFHRPEKFGDNLTKIRETIAFVNENKKYIDGFEAGRIYNGYRFVYPFFDGEKHIGSVEVSFSTLSMTTELMKNFDVVSKIIVSKKVIGNKVFKEEMANYAESRFEDYFYEKKMDEMIEVYNKNNIKLVISEDTKKIIKKRGLDPKSFSLYDSASDTIMTFLKLHNPITHNVVGILVIKSDAEEITSKIENTRFNFVIFVLLFGVLHIFIYRVLHQKELLRELVKQKTQELLTINQELAQSHNEIDLINKNLEIRIAEEIAQNRIKDKIISEQSKMVAMGEMIGAIAHQWRQPLNELSIRIQKLKIYYNKGEIDGEFIQNFIKSNIATIDFMSKTIDDFRNFFKIEKTKQQFNLKDAVLEIVDMFSYQLSTYNIEVEIIGDKKTDCIGFRSEFQQVILNLINNAKDALIEKGINNPKITITIDDTKLTIEDNAGGISEDIMERIFEPYFTTKDENKGTGLGLYMSRTILEQNMDCKFDAYNSDHGALFSIVFSKNSQIEDKNEKL